VEEGTYGPLLHAKFHPHRFNVSPLRGEKPQNRPLSKLNTGRFALRAMLPVIRPCRLSLHKTPIMVLVWAASDHRKHNHHHYHYHQLHFTAVSWFPICSRREHLEANDLLQAGRPSCHPTNSVKALNETHSTEANHRKSSTSLILS